MSLKDKKAIRVEDAMPDLFRIPGYEAKFEEAQWDLEHPRLALIKGWMRKARRVSFWLAVLAAFDVVFVFTIGGAKFPFL